MIIRIEKSDDIKVSNHFDSMPFHCQCQFPECSYTLIDSDLLELLDKVASIYDDLRITSAYRCQKHNAQVGGAPLSYHVKGQAADFNSKQAGVDELYHMLDHMLKVRGGLGKYASHVHVDTAERIARWKK